LKKVKQLMKQVGMDLKTLVYPEISLLLVRALKVGSNANRLMLNALCGIKRYVYLLCEINL